MRVAVRRVLTPRWSRWLDSQLNLRAIVPNALAKRLARDEPGGAYLNQVRKWMKAEAHPSALLAFRVGQELPSLRRPASALVQPDFDYVSGPVALLAAGHLAEFVNFVCSLGTRNERTAVDHATVLITCGPPALADLDLNSIDAVVRQSMEGARHWLGSYARQGASMSSEYRRQGEKIGLDRYQRVWDSTTSARARRAKEPSATALSSLFDSMLGRRVLNPMDTSYLTLGLLERWARIIATRDTENHLVPMDDIARSSWPKRIEFLRRYFDALDSEREA